MTEKTRKRILLIILIALLVLIGLWILELNGIILNIQAYFNLRISLFVFWVFFAMIFWLILKSDTGFFKIGAMIGIFTAFVVLIINTAINDTDFQPLKSEDQKIVLEITDQPTYYQIKVYDRQNFLLSEYLDEVKVAKYYEYTYYIEDNEFVVERCGVSSCTYLTVPLE
jgi:hypothetical protein